MDELGVEGLVNRVFPGPPAGHVTTWLSQQNAHIC